MDKLCPDLHWLNLVVMRLSALVSIAFCLTATVFGGPIDKPTEYMYLWGGLEPDSFLYWPVKPIDTLPLTLVRSGKRTEAFELCLQRMKKTKGDAQFFYAIQAASLGFGLYRSREVALYLARDARELEMKQLNSHSQVFEMESDRMLAIVFAFRLSVQSEFELGAKHHPKMLIEDSRFSHIEGELKRRTFSRIEHLCVLATLVDFESHSTPMDKRLNPSGNARQHDPRFSQRAWKAALAKNPTSPELNMVVSTKMRLAYLDGGPDYFANITKYAETALKLNPSYSRAMVRIAEFKFIEDPHRSKLLLEEAIRLKGLLPSELKLAHTLLANIEKRKNPKGVSRV